LDAYLEENSATVLFIASKIPDDFETKMIRAEEI
jgi:hypothetical protein